MPYLRQTSPVFDPASCSRRTAIIRSSVNLDCLIFRLPQGDGLYLFLEQLQGLRSLRIDDPHLFQSRDDLQSRVKTWRERYPWLDNWCFTEATHAWGNSILMFTNVEKPAFGEFSEQSLVAANNGFGTPIENHEFIPFQRIV